MMIKAIRVVQKINTFSLIQQRKYGIMPQNFKDFFICYKLFKPVLNVDKMAINSKNDVRKIKFIHPT
jgi:hypothetical protein